MKLKIVHQNQENRKGEEQAPRTEAKQMEEPQIRAPPENDSLNENSPLLEPPPVPASHSLLVSGKRKRKPKELIDEISPIVMRRRKKPTPLQSKDAPFSGGTLISEVDATVGRSGNHVQLKSPTMIRAEEFQLSLNSELPSFMKVLVRSHVASCFWMGLPVPFCKAHLPSKDATVALEDENGVEFLIKYIAHKTGLSAGWRKFVAGNKLIEGDVLIFQLIGPCRFKVYIIRANDLTEVDGALSLLILDSQIKQNDADGAADAKSKKKRRPKSLPLTVVQKKKHKAGQVEEQSGNDSDEVASEVLEGTKFSGTSQFKDIKSFQDFHIVVNGACVDSDLPENIRRKYYELCCSKNAFLHDRLLPGLYSKLAAGMIVESINIADAIRASKLTTPREDFEVWEKSLRSFELLGLNVGFLRARLQKLLRLAFDSEGASEARRYLEVQKDQRQAKYEIEKLEAKLVELKELSAKYDNEMEKLKAKAERFEGKFQEEINAAW